ncbi:MAG: hypothetical protein ACYCWW_08065 [Deltaproteobacteria bacterium]
MTLPSLDDRPDGFWTPRRVTAFVWTQLLAWLALGEALLPTHGHYLYDEAFFYLRSFEVAHGAGLAADGPFISGTNPTAYTPGGALFELYAPPFFVARDPRWGVAWVVLLSAIGILLLDRALHWLEATGRMRVATATLATWTIWHARYTDRMWNVDAFLFAAPLLLWLTARLRRAPAAHRWAWALAFGAAAALCLQIHLSGAVVVALCALLVWPALAPRERFDLAGWAAVGAVVLYLPWIRAQIPLHFAGLSALRQGRPAGRLFGAGLDKTSVVFAKFASQAARRSPERPPSWAPWLSLPWLAFLSFWITVPLVALGLFVRSRWRVACLVGLLLVPCFLAASGRDYFDHYVIAPFPFYVLPAATALAWLAGRGRLLALVAAVYLAGFALLGARLLTLEYGGNYWDWTENMQLEVTSHLTSLGRPIAPQGESLLSEQSLIYETLAHNVLEQPLRFDPSGAPCWLDNSPRIHAFEWPIAGGRHWLGCDR